MQESKPNFIPTLQDTFKQMTTSVIVIKYATQNVGLSKLVRFHNLVFSWGYLEKKYDGR